MKNNTSTPTWLAPLIIAVLFVALVLGIMQRLDRSAKNQNTTTTQDEVLTEFTCTDSGGEWDACGSACRGEEAEDPEVICAEVCVEHCYCHGDGECPADHHCVEYVEDTGVCVIEF